MGNIRYKGKSFLKEHFTFIQARKLNPEITIPEYNKILGEDLVLKVNEDLKDLTNFEVTAKGIPEKKSPEEVVKEIPKDKKTIRTTK